MSHFTVLWNDIGRETQVAADPDYPYGRDEDVSHGEVPTCRVELPYPAVRVGCHVLVCGRCNRIAYCAASGRADDPRSIRVSCKLARG